MSSIITPTFCAKNLFCSLQIWARFNGLRYLCPTWMSWVWISPLLYVLLKKNILSLLLFYYLSNQYLIINYQYNVLIFTNFIIHRVNQNSYSFKSLKIKIAHTYFHNFIIVWTKIVILLKIISFPNIWCK